MSEHVSKGHLHGDSLEEHDMATARGISVQTQRKDRKAGRSSPYFKDGKRYYYPIELARQHYAAQVIYPAGSPLKAPKPARARRRQHQPAKGASASA